MFLIEKNHQEDVIATSERVYFPEDDPSFGAKEHLDRYNFAAGFLNGNETVLDAACGTGYGSSILCKKAAKVLGMDISSETIKFAQDHYQQKNIRFQACDASREIPLPDESVDVVVSFETLEHVRNQENMLSEFKRVLKKGGRLVISTPDNDLISGGLPSDNPFHVKELDKKEFVELLSKFFEIRQLYGQTLAAEMPVWKTVLKSFRKIGFLRKAKQKLAKKMGIEKKLHQSLGAAAEKYCSITPVSLEEKNKYYVLIAVSTK